MACNFARVFKHTSSSISLVWPAEMQNLARSCVIFVAGNPTPTVARLYLRQPMTKPAIFAGMNSIRGTTGLSS